MLKNRPDPSAHTAPANSNLQVGYGWGQGEDAFAVGKQAAENATRDLRLSSLATVLVFASVRYDLQKVLQGIHRVVGESPVLGATTAGEICDRPLKESVVVVALASPYLKVRIGLGQGVSQDWQQAVTQALTSADIRPFFTPQDRDIWSVLTRQGKSAFALLFSPGNTRGADSRSFEILEELKRLSYGRLPIIGGAAADDWRLATNYVLWGGRAYPDSVLVAVFETQLRFGIAMAHGFRPSTSKATVTRARQHEVLELDGKPAAEVYPKMLGLYRHELEGKHLTLTSKRPAGILDPYGQYSLNVASFFTPEQGVRFSQPVSEGTVLTIMEAEKNRVIAAGGEAVRKAVLRGSILDPALILTFPCALRSRILEDEIAEEIDGMHQILPAIPLVGFYSFGEQAVADDGVSRHNNEVIATLVLDRELSYGAQVALELHETARSLEQSRNMLRFILESIPVRVFWKDMNCRYLGCNTLFARDAGLSHPDELLGRDDFVMGWRDQAELYRADDRRVMESGRPRLNIVEPQTTPNGDQIWLSTSKVPLRTPAGEVFGVLGVYEDITARKQAEEALRASEERYRMVANYTYDMEYWISPTGEILYMSPACERLSGYPAQAFIDDPSLLVRIIHPDDHAMFSQNLRIERNDNSHKHCDIDFRLTKRNGMEIWVNHTCQPVFGMDGSWLGRRVCNRDITDRKKAEEERLKFNKLESLGTLAGGIAHDFNNILTAIMGHISIAMLDQSAGPSRKNLAEAERACTRAQHLSGQLLTFAKGGAPVKQLVSLADMLTETVSFAVSGSQVRCTFDFPDKLWALEADQSQINQVIQNLAINALQAMPMGGTIEMQGENLVVKEETDLPLAAGKYVKIAIKDQGTGIPADHLSKIFDPYFTTKQTGSGLGLATAYSVVRSHEGHIAVESTLGKGTTFTIYLPAVARTIEPPDQKGEVLIGQGKILVMDDDAMVRQILEQMLRRLGYEVRLARDGAEAVEMFHQTKAAGNAFEAVILDLTVPGGMGGKETLEQLLRIDPRVKAIVSSGYSRDAIMAEFAQYGFCGVIAKPYQLADLSKLLHEVIRENRQTPQA